MQDTERKILRILWNLYQNNWSRPDLEHICRLSVRPRHQVRSCIKKLVETGYIEVQPGALRVIQSREQELPRWRPMN